MSECRHCDTPTEWAYLNGTGPAERRAIEIEAHPTGPFVFTGQRIRPFRFNWHMAEIRRLSPNTPTELARYSAHHCKDIR